MTVQSFPDVPRERIDAALTAIKATGAAYLIPIFEAVRDHGCANLVVSQLSMRFDMPPVNKPIIAIIGEDMTAALGPRGFPRSSLKQLFRLCGTAAIVAGRPDADVYMAIAAKAAADRQHVALIETRAEKEREWKAFLYAANPDIATLEAFPFASGRC